ncbi:hypothetical protein [Shewanella sp. Koi 1]
MIPNNTWIDDETRKQFATYGKTKPAFSSRRLSFVTLGSAQVSASNETLTDAWWAFEHATGGVFKLYRYTDNAWVYHSDLFTVGSCTAFSAAFDQLGKPLVFFDTGGELRLWWFDPVLAAHTTTVFGEGEYPFTTFDIKYEISNSTSDVLLFYVRDGAIYYRMQRDRYVTEYSTPIISDATTIQQADIATDYRMQIVYRALDTGYSPPTPEAPTVDPTAGKWAYLLNGYQSALEIPLSDATSNIVSHEAPFSVSFEITKAERLQEQTCLFSYGSPGFGPRVSVSIGGTNNDTVYVRYWGGSIVQKMPFKLQNGHWKLEFYRLNGTGVNDTLRVSVKPPNASDYMTHVVNHLSAKILAAAPLLRIGNRAVYSEQFYRVPGDFSTAYTVNNEYAFGLRGIISNIELRSELAAEPIITIPITKDQAAEQALLDDVGVPITDALGAPLTANLVDYRAANWAFIPT